MFIDTELRPQGEINQDQEVRRVLLAAADLLERDGWCQKALSDGQGRRCVLQAMIDGGGSDRLYEAKIALCRYLGLETSFPCVSPWNNAPERTQPEVLAALRGAAGS